MAPTTCRGVSFKSNGKCRSRDRFQPTNHCLSDPPLHQNRLVLVIIGRVAIWNVAPMERGRKGWSQPEIKRSAFQPLRFPPPLLHQYLTTMQSNIYRRHFFFFNFFFLNFHFLDFSIFPLLCLSRLSPFLTCFLYLFFPLPLSLSFSSCIFSFFFFLNLFVFFIIVTPFLLFLLLFFVSFILRFLS